MCILSQVAGPCSHFECYCYAYLAKVGLAPLNTDQLAQRVLSVLDAHNQLLSQLVRDNKKNQSLMTDIGKEMHVLQSEKTESAPAQTIFNPGANVQYRYQLKLITDLPDPIFKEKGFSIALQIREKGEFVLDKSMFVVGLYSQDEPPKLINSNIFGKGDVGKKAIRGTLKAQPDEEGYLHFPNVVINEVSSHYVNDEFYLVVSDFRRPEVRPLVKGVTVRARKCARRV